MKKRITALLLAFAISLSLATPAMAEEVVQPIETTYVNPVYADIVSEEELQTSDFQPPIAMFAAPTYETDETVIAEQIRAAMVERIEDVTLYYATSEELPDDFLDSWMEMAFAETKVPNEGDYLRWQMGGADCSAGGYITDKIYYTVQLKIYYYTNAEQEAIVDERVEELIESLGINNKMSDYKKVSLIYEWICNNVVYDYPHLNNSSYKLQFTAYAALVNGTSVCQGYSNLLYRLLREVGINVRCIHGIGNGGGHAWNIIELDGIYYLADATWDSEYYTKLGKYEYFLKGLNDFEDHYPYSQYDNAAFYQEYPVSTTNYNLYVHTHTYSKEWFSDEETHWYECSCGVKDYVSNHNFMWITDKVPTEDEEGIKHEMCGTCKYVRNEGTVIDKLPHKHEMYYAWEKPATCSKEGNIAYYGCKKCGNCYVDPQYTQQVAYEDTIIPKLPHNWDEGKCTIEVTCTTNGERTFTCQVCKEIKTEVIEAKGHQYYEWWDFDEESHFFSCECGDRTAVEQHTFVWIIDKPATENETGLKHLECTGCKVMMKVGTVIDKLSHSHELDMVEAKAATCVEKGNIEYYVCKSCNKIYSDSLGNLEISMEDTVLETTEHLWDEGVTITEPTCTSPGKNKNTCKACGETVFGDMKPIEHSFEWIIDIPATSIPGTKHEECTVCGFKRNEGTVIEPENPMLSPGDITGDGTIDTSDAQLIFNIFMGITSIDDVTLLNIADVTGDGTVDTSDAQMVFNMFMGII